MSSYYMWIILGVLIAVVVGFLLVSTILDRKKKKKFRAEQLLEHRAMRDALGKMAIAVNLVNNYNRQLLAQFVPSIGKMRMSDLNKAMHQEIKALVQGQELNKIREEEIKQTVLKHLLTLLNDKSNNWDKKDQATIRFFESLEKNLQNKEHYQAFKTSYKARITVVYQKLLTSSASVQNGAKKNAQVQAAPKPLEANKTKVQSKARKTFKQVIRWQRAVPKQKRKVGK